MKNAMKSIALMLALFAMYFLLVADMLRAIIA